MFRLHMFRSGCKLLIWCQVRKLRVMLVSSLGSSRQNGLLAAEGAQGPAWKPLRGVGEGLDVTGRVGWEKLWKLNMLRIFRWDIKGGKGALVEKVLLKRLNVLVSEMGSEPEGRSCGFGLERLEHVQNKQTELTWDVEFVTEGSSSCWNTAVMFSSRLWRAGHSEHLQSTGAAKRAQGPSEQNPAWTLPALEKRVKNLEDTSPGLFPLMKITF